MLRKRHLTPDGRTGVHVIWRDLDPDDVIDRVTTPLRTVVDCATRLPFDQALVVADAALRCGDVRPDELADAVSLLRGIGSSRRQPTAGRRTRSSRCCGRSASTSPGLSLTPQVQIADDGIWAVVDLADEDLRLVVEAEGFAFHGTRHGPGDADDGRRHRAGRADPAGRRRRPVP